MRLTLALMLTTILIVLSGCNQSGGSAEMAQSGMPSDQGGNAAQPANPGTAATRSEIGVDTVSLKSAEGSQNAPLASERKIIRNATLAVELDAPAEAQRKISSIAEARGGFVVTSESKLQNRGGGADEKPYEIVTIEVRVPAAQFDAALGEIRALGGGRVTEEKITGQDVTEEFIDLEARVRTKKALEAQFMEIMKQASKVSDALEVQNELAEVRTEIERLEGRRRFLENQSSLSTIKVTLRPPATLIAASTSGFVYSVKEAVGDGVDFAAGILLGLIRVGIALIPVALFIFLPLALLARFLIRRQRRLRLGEQLKQQIVPEP